MWKITLGFGFHRLALLAIALFTLYSSLSKTNNVTGFKLHSLSELVHAFVSRVEQGPEAKILSDNEGKPAKEIFSYTSHPFIWVGRYVRVVTGLGLGLIVLFLSNLFVFLFIWETYTLASRFALPEVAEATALLATFWITSYELSLGSELSLTCFLVALVLRHALDNQWLIGGIALGGLALTEPFAVFLLPVLAGVFWFYQQHFQMLQVIRRLIYFLFPIALVVASNWPEFSSIPTLFKGSALMQLTDSYKSGSLLGFTVAQSTFGQTLTMILFTVSAGSAFFANGMFMHRIVPAYIWVVVLLFSPYGQIASRALLAGIALEGIASVSANSIVRGILLVCLAFSSYEIFLVFR